jgi:hypothetical protein
VGGNGTEVRRLVGADGRMVVAEEREGLAAALVTMRGSERQPAVRRLTERPPRHPRPWLLGTLVFGCLVLLRLVFRGWGVFDRGQQEAWAMGNNGQ